MKAACSLVSGVLLLAGCAQQHGFIASHEQLKLEQRAAVLGGATAELDEVIQRLPPRGSSEDWTRLRDRATALRGRAMGLLSMRYEILLGRHPTTPPEFYNQLERELPGLTEEWKAVREEFLRLTSA